MEELIAYILKYIQLTEKQIDYLKTNAKLLQLKKGDFFSMAGKTAREVGFVKDGVLRVCYYEADGKDITLAFLEENHLVADLASFNTKSPSSVSIEAVMDSELIILGEELFKKSTDLIIPWNEFFNKVMTEAFFKKGTRGSVMLVEDAKKRYLTFLEENPNLVNRIPLSSLASYLGITQSSLSRIRKNI